jgi:beta-phosphoglucomutase family hydrolase
MKFKGALFDMDGVLVDNMPVHMEAFGLLARRYEVEFDFVQVLGMAGKGNAELFTEVFPHDIIERVGVTVLAAEKEAIYRELYAPKLIPMPGLIEFLDKLRAAGVKMAVGSSAPAENIDFVLDSLDIRRYFDAVVGADMVTRCKPDPEIYLVAATKLGLSPFDCIVFEDALAGIQAARAAGMDVIALATTVDRILLEVQPGVVITIKNFTESGKLKVES